jgi:hypothetical protein
MAHNTSSLPTLPTSQTLSQTSLNVPIAPPTPPSVAGSDGFYLIIALAVLIRAIVNPPTPPSK